MLETKKIMWMLKKDLLVLWRHPPRLIAMFLYPIIMLTIIGYGMGGTIDNIPVVVVEQSHGPVTDATLTTIKGMSFYNVKDIITDPDKGKEMVQNGQVKAAIILPTNYDNLKDTQQKDVIIDIDSSDQMASSAIIPVTQALFNQISNQIGMQTLNSKYLTYFQSSKSPSTTEEIFNPSNVTPQGISFQSIMNSINLQIDKLYGNIRYIDFLAPAVIGTVILFSCMNAMGDSIAGERERGELPRLFMTPTSISTIVVGKIISKLGIETIWALILIVGAVVLFNIAIYGNMALMFLILILGELCFVGFGIMISARVSTQEDYQKAIMPIAMPMMFISGVFYPIETMPWIFQKLAYLMPLTYVNEALRAVMLKGAGIGDIWMDLVVLLGFTALFSILGITRFNRDI